MKIAAAVLVVVLFAAPVVGERAADREHVHDEYEVPYNVQLGGIGGGLFQGVTKVYVTYDPVLPDSDAINETNTVRGHITLAVYGPGSNIVAATAASSVIINNGCGVATIVATSSGVATTRSHHTQTWRVFFDQTSRNPTYCELIVRVTNTGPTAYVLDLPVLFYNDDASTRPFFLATGLSAIEFVIFYSLMIVGFYLWSRQDKAVQLFGVILIGSTAALAVGLIRAGADWVGLSMLLVLSMMAFGYTAIMWVLDLRKIHHRGLL